MRRERAILISLAVALWAWQASAQSADLVISKSGTESASAGDTITYSIFIFNNGPDTAQNVTVSDPLPSGTTFVSMSASDATFTCTTPAVGSGGTVTCTAPAFALEGSVNFTLSVKTSAAAPSGLLTNTATITSAAPDPNTSDNSSTVTTGIAGSVTASADLSIESMSGSPAASSGATMSFQVVIANKGPSTAHHVQLIDAVPANATFAAISVADPLGEFTCTTPAVGTSGNVTCSAPSFDQRVAGDQPAFLFTFRVNNGVAAGTALTNSAMLASDQGDPNALNNTASRTTNVTSQAPSADLFVVTSGQSSTFSVIARNAGPNDAGGVTLTDSVPSGSTFAGWTQANGPKFNCVTPSAGGTGTITCTIDIFPGIAGSTVSAEFALTLDTLAQVVNSVSISSATTDPRPDNNTSAYPVAGALRIDDVSVLEGNSGTTPAVFTVGLLPANATLTATARYQISGITATPGVDFLSSDGTLTFLAGETQKTITVLVAGDAQKESDETFSVQIVEAVNARVDRGAAIGTIVDDDQSAPAFPTVSIANVSVTEGNSATTNATFTAQLSFAAAVVSRVRWQTQDGTAIAGSDYIASSGELVFQPGELSKPFTVPITGDTNFEPDETFVIVITGADNVSASPGQAATGTIVNDDSPPPSRRRAARP
jgi:conserved repeat domain/conserved repeat domain/conserved repeat domain